MSEAIDEFLSARVASQEIPSVVAMGISQDDVLYEGAFGLANTQTGTAINIETRSL